MWFCLPTRKTRKAGAGCLGIKGKELANIEQSIPQSIFLVTKQPFHSFLPRINHTHSPPFILTRQPQVLCGPFFPLKVQDLRVIVSALHQLPCLFPKIWTKKRTVLTNNGDVGIEPLQEKKKIRKQIAVTGSLWLRNPVGQVLWRSVAWSHTDFLG